MQKINELKKWLEEGIRYLERESKGSMSERIATYKAIIYKIEDILKLDESVEKNPVKKTINSFNYGFISAMIAMGFSASLVSVFNVNSIILKIIAGTVTIISVILFYICIKKGWKNE